MSDLYDYLLRVWALVQAIADANLAWFPPKLAFLVQHFIPIDRTICSEHRKSDLCTTFIYMVEARINEVIKPVYNRWVVYDYAIFIASFVWSLMNNNLNSQCLTLIATFVAGHIVQTGGHAISIKKATHCRGIANCGWSAYDMTKLHGMITFAFGIIYMICLRSNTNTQKMGRRIERMEACYESKFEKMNAKLEDVMTRNEQLEDCLKQTVNEVISLRAQNKTLSRHAWETERVRRQPLLK